MKMCVDFVIWSSLSTDYFTHWKGRIYLLLWIFLKIELIVFPSLYIFFQNIKMLFSGFNWIFNMIFNVVLHFGGQCRDYPSKNENLIKTYPLLSSMERRRYFETSHYCGPQWPSLYGQKQWNILYKSYK